MNITLRHGRLKCSIDLDIFDAANIDTQREDWVDAAAELAGSFFDDVMASISEASNRPAAAVRRDSRQRPCPAPLSPTASPRPAEGPPAPLTPTHMSRPRAVTVDRAPDFQPAEIRPTPIKGHRSITDALFAADGD